MKKVFFWQEEGFSFVQFAKAKAAAVKGWFMEIKYSFDDRRKVADNMKLIRETIKSGNKVVIKIDPAMIKDYSGKSRAELVKTLAMVTCTLQYMDLCYGTGVRDLLVYEMPNPKDGKILSVSVKDTRKGKKK